MPPMSDTRAHALQLYYWAFAAALLAMVGGGIEAWTGSTLLGVIVCLPLSVVAGSATDTAVDRLGRILS